MCLEAGGALSECGTTELHVLFWLSCSPQSVLLRGYIVVRAEGEACNPRRAMGLSYVCLHASYKFKLLMLFTACILVVGWATSSYLVDAVHETPAVKSAVASFGKPTTSAEEQKEVLEWQAGPTVKLPTVKLSSVKSFCPAISPYLRKCPSWFLW